MKITNLVMRRLDEDGAPTGEPIQVEGYTLEYDTTPLLEPCAPVITVPRQSVSFTVRMPAAKELMRLLLGPDLMAKARRAQRHRARIRVVPRRRYKHGRVGVFR